MLTALDMENENPSTNCRTRGTQVDCLLLIVHPSKASTAKMKYMVALDGSDNSHKAYIMAEKLMKENDIVSYPIILPPSLYSSLN